jgi:hypothetical protein
MASDDHIAFVRLRSKTTREWFVHEDLRPRLVADAAERGTNLSDVAVDVLCKRFAIPFEPNGRKTHPQRDDDVINLRLPAALYRALVSAYAVKYQDGIRHVLCAYYGLSVPERAPATRRRRVAAA